MFNPVSKEKVKLIGPYECGYCQGHLMIDASFLEQVDELITCPYCKLLQDVEGQIKDQVCPELFP